MTKMLCWLLAGSMHVWVWHACIKKKKKKAFLWKEQRRAVWPQWKWMMHLFPAHPKSHLTCYLLYWRVRIWSTLVSSFFICSYCPPFVGFALTNHCWPGWGCVEGSLQFMPGEEALDSKCIRKRGAERQTRRITEAPQSWWRSHFPWERKWSGGPSSSSPWHNCFVLLPPRHRGIQ